MDMGVHLTRSSVWFPDRIALVYKNVRLTYKKFNERVNRLANALHSLGLTKGDHVAFLSSNRHHLIEAFYACHKAGMVTVPLNARLSIPEAVKLLNHSRSDVLLAGRELVDGINGARSQMETVKHVIATSHGLPGMLDYEQLLSEADGNEPEAVVSVDDLISIEYTSGTSGVLKATMMTHRNFLSMSKKQLMVPGLDLDRESVMCHVAPVTHGTVAMVLPTIVRGGCNLILPGFDVPLLLETIQRERVTHLLLVPTMINFIMAHPDVRSYDLSSIRTIFYAASPMPAVRVQQALELFGPVLIQTYGCHESSAMITYLPKEDHIHNNDPRKLKRLGSAGIPAMESDVRVVNETGEDVRPGEVGEIIQRGDDTMLGYWNDPETTAEVLVDGWLHTHDMATVDEQGYIYIVDRKADMIISGGFNIFPFEVEEVLYRHPAVFEAAVISIPDDKWGEAVKAVVVLKEGESATEEGLISHCKSFLSSYKKPKSVDFIDELPKNATGKVLRRVLKEKYWKDQDRMVH